jgi:hypothetical protein
MNPQIEKALKASIQEYAAASNQKSDVFGRRVAEAFKSDRPYLEKVDLLDRVFDDFIHFDDLREVYFDLLLINFFAVDVAKLESDYLESPEWEDIENRTIDRGTELLNVLLYLRECKDEKIDADLDDFLKEFLLVEEDEFQDEHRIYEPFIANQILVDSTYEEIAKVAGKLDPDQEVADLFYPVMSFFSESEPTEAQFEEFVNYSKNKAFDAAIYALILAYNQS